MEREPLPQITTSGGLLFVAIVFFYIINLIPTLNFERTNTLPFVGIAVGVSVALATLISQITISIWSIVIGFAAIDYSRIFKDLGNKKLVQSVFDKFMHGCNNKGNAYICNSVREYCRRRVAVYWLHLVSLITSVFIIVVGTALFIIANVSNYWLILFYIFYIGIIILNYKHKEHAAGELFRMQKDHFERFQYKDQIIDGIKNPKVDC